MKIRIIVVEIDSTDTDYYGSERVNVYHYWTTHSVCIDKEASVLTEAEKYIMHGYKKLINSSREEDHGGFCKGEIRKDLIDETESLISKLSVFSENDFIVGNKDLCTIEVPEPIKMPFSLTDDTGFYLNIDKEIEACKQKEQYLQQKKNLHLLLDLISRNHISPDELLPPSYYYSVQKNLENEENHSTINPLPIFNFERNICDGKFLSPLDFACYMGDFEAISFMANHGSKNKALYAPLFIDRHIYDEDIVNSCASYALIKILANRDEDLKKICDEDSLIDIITDICCSDGIYGYNSGIANWFKQQVWHDFFIRTKSQNFNYWLFEHINNYENLWKSIPYFFSKKKGGGLYMAPFGSSILKHPRFWGLGGFDEWYQNGLKEDYAGIKLQCTSSKVCCLKKDSLILKRIIEKPDSNIRVREFENYVDHLEQDYDDYYGYDDERQHWPKITINEGDKIASCLVTVKEIYLRNNGRKISIRR